MPYDDVRENEIIYFPLGNSINLLMITSQVKSSLVVKIIVFFIAKIVILSEDNNKNVPIRMSYFISCQPRDSCLANSLAVETTFVRQATNNVSSQVAVNFIANVSFHLPKIKIKC